MSGTSGRSKRPNSKDSSASTSSQASAGGPKPSVSPAGQLDLFGQPVAHAHPSAQPARRKPAPSAVVKTLSRALDELASSFAASAGTPGTPTKGTCGPKYGGSSATVALQRSLESRLVDVMEEYGSPLFGLRWNFLGMPLGAPILQRAALERSTSDSDSFGWPTPEAHNAKGSRSKSQQATRLAGGPGGDLVATAQLAAWSTPTVQDSSNNAAPPGPSFSQTGKPGLLNPAFSLWLMGFPAAWACCGARAMQSARKSARPSSERSCKRSGCSTKKELSE